MASPGSNFADPRPGAGTDHPTPQEHGDSLMERAREKAGELKQQAEKTAGEMRERARSMVDRQKDAAAGRVEGVAHALRRASDDLREQGQPTVADYSRQVAEGLESMADSLSRRNVDDLVGDVERFARARPAAFLSGAVVAGFALARFMKSSSARREERSAAERRAAPTSASGTPGTPTRPGGTPTAAPGSAATPAGGAYGTTIEGGL